MFRNLISFLRSPEEGRPFDFKPRSILSSFCFSQKIYCEDQLLIRIGIALVAGVCLFLLLGKFMMNCRFKPYFWFWGVFFGCIHLMNRQMTNYRSLSDVMAG